MNTYRKFLFKITLFLIPVIILPILSFWGLFVEQNFGNQFLYHYQIEKLAFSENLDTIFVGDSSLGNSIDSQYFNQLTSTKSINLALSGMYGYAGSYNLIKRATETSTEVQNVIIMQTPDMMQRNVSYAGYLHTSVDLEDLLDLEYAEFLDMTSTFFHHLYSKNGIRSIFYSMGSKLAGTYTGNVYWLGVCWTPFPERASVCDRKDRRMIADDYIQQNLPPDWNQVTNISLMSPDNINQDKIKFLLKIRDLCKNKQLNCIYIHGPLWIVKAMKSEDYINAVNAHLVYHGIKIVDENVFIRTTDVGDNDDHVLPGMKKIYTEKYVDILKEHLLVRLE